MGNREDWKELEKWADEDRRRKIEKYKFDIESEKLQNQAKKTNIVSKILNRIGKIGMAIAIAFGGILIFAILNFALDAFQTYNIDAKGSIQNMYDIKVKIVSKDTDDRGNGNYIFAVKGNKELKFSAIKKYGTLYEDYADNLQKYVFTKWNSQNKNKIIEDEKTEENGLLKYSMYMEINSYTEIEELVEILNEFMEYAKTYDNTSFVFLDLELRNKDSIIKPFWHTGITKEEAIAGAKKQYLYYVKENKIDEDIEEEEFKKYLGANTQYITN